MQPNKKEKNMQLFSKNFKDQEEIPIQYTCDTSDFAPGLEWEDAPPETKSFAIICRCHTSPNGSSGPWIHWLVYGIPAPAFQLREKLPPFGEHESGLKQGINSFGKLGYSGPCPETGTHTYQFTLYALDKDLNLPPEIPHQALVSAMENHILATAQLTGKYSFAG